MNPLHDWYCRSAYWQATLDRLVPWALAGAALGDHVLEIGPGPGLVTPMLASRAGRVTAIDRDRAATAAARGRRDDRVRIVEGDAASLPFASGTFSAIVAFTMLHHLPTAALQDRVFREAARTLRPGGAFIGLDVRASLALRLFHLGDTFVPLPADTLPARLSAAAFGEIDLEARDGHIRFRARRGRGARLG